MPKNANGQEVFDGHVVENYNGTFSGSFDLEPDEGRTLAWGDEAVFLVVGRVNGARLAETSGGDAKRIHVIKPTEVRVIRDKEQVAELYGLADALDDELPLNRELGSPITGGVQPGPVASTEIEDSPMEGLVPAGIRGVPVTEVAPVRKEDEVLKRFLSEGV